MKITHKPVAEISKHYYNIKKKWMDSARENIISLMDTNKAQVDKIEEMIEHIEKVYPTLKRDNYIYDNLIFIQKSLKEQNEVVLNNFLKFKSTSLNKGITYKEQENEL